MSLMDAGSLVLRVWDHGLVDQELVKNKLFPRALNDKQVEAAQGLIVPDTAPDHKLSEGTFSGTAKALTDVYHRIEDRFTSYFDVIGVAPSIPITDKHTGDSSPYQWSARTGPNADKYPPHLNLIPSQDNLPVYKIFDAMRLLDTGFVLESIVPDTIKDFIYSHPDQGATMAAIDEKNVSLRKAKKNILSEPNVGDRVKTKWYTDEVFAQQQFTGTNPVTIELASAAMAEEFRQAATKQSKKEHADLIAAAAKTKSLYVQDCSYFRKAANVPNSQDFVADVKDKKKPRFACATVTLFNLTDAGKLHPLSIIIDYKGSAANSVVIFNTRLTPDQTADQARDWPWRYAKSAAMSADWVRHEATVHLTNCHLVEEATIVASQRALPTNHLVYRCLQPHWLKTLPLNAAARATLVPFVVIPLIGFTGEQTYGFLRDAYKRFDWQANYVPADLERRGFPIKELTDMNNKKFHNYAYGKMAYLFWQVMRKFVAAFLRNGDQGFTSDAKVAADPSIQTWCHEMQKDDGGQMKTWPTIQTFDQLVDCVTMCIHIAAPQHTAVNYLQEYYQSFVVNKPPAMCAPLPQTINALQSYQEKDLMAGLPINRPQEWLLASHLVHLLNSRVASDQNLVNYALSLYHLTLGSGEKALNAAAKTFFDDLVALGDSTDSVGAPVKGVFTKISELMDDQEVPYKVMDPHFTAVSILI